MPHNLEVEHEMSKLKYSVPWQDVQSHLFAKLGARTRARVWRVCGVCPYRRLGCVELGGVEQGWSVVL